MSETLENIDFRLDAEFHRKMALDNPLYHYVSIGSILTLAQYGLSIDMNEDGTGYPIYRMNEIENMLCTRNIAKYAAISYTEAEPFILNQGDVLFNRTNSQAYVGRTGLYKSFNNSPRVFASYLVRLVADRNKVLPEYLTTFLNSSLGISDVKRRARISINQSNVNAEEVKAVRIPLLSMALQQKIADLFALSHQATIKSYNLYSQAENLLLDVLGLRNWQPPLPLTYNQNASTAFAIARLDAEYFQPKYEAILSHIRQQGWRLGFVRDFAIYCDRGEQPEYSEVGNLAVINSRHILEHSLDYDNLERTNSAAWDDPRFISARVQHYDILIYTTGSFAKKPGRNAVYFDDKPALASNHVNILRVRNEHPIYISVVLNSIIGLMQAESASTGSIQQELYPNDIAGFVIPFVDFVTEAQIVASVEASHLARRRAKILLEAAKQAVEIAIEQSEEAALSFLRRLDD